MTLTAPLNGTTVELGSDLLLTATAFDADGTVASVEFSINGGVIGASVSAPYALNWTPPTVGSYTVQANVTDNEGAQGASDVIEVLVTQAPPPPPPDGEVVESVLERAVEGYAGVADTYLSNYHKNNNFGGSIRLNLDRNNYVPLMKFAVFQSEGGPVPDGATIESASLHVFKGAYDSVIALHAMRVPWSEQEATWNRPSQGTSWGAAGANASGLDFEATPDSQIDAAWSSGEIVFDVTARIRLYASGQPNHGWRFIDTAGNRNRKQLSASETVVTGEFRPRLEVRWSMGATQD